MIALLIIPLSSDVYLEAKVKQSGRTPWRAASLCAERKALLRA